MLFLNDYQEAESSFLNKYILLPKINLNIQELIKK